MVRANAKNMLGSVDITISPTLDKEGEVSISIGQSSRLGINTTSQTNNLEHIKNPSEEQSKKWDDKLKLLASQYETDLLSLATEIINDKC